MLLAKAHIAPTYLSMGNALATKYVGVRAVADNPSFHGSLTHISEQPVMLSQRLLL